MGVPQVVIVGRPNVGKSSVFNWLAGERIAIVDDKPGVTRDRLTHLMCHDDRFFELVDTGGMGIEDIDNLTEHIEEQIKLGDRLGRRDPVRRRYPRRACCRSIRKSPAAALRRRAGHLRRQQGRRRESFDAQADEFYQLGARQAAPHQHAAEPQPRRAART